MSQLFADPDAYVSLTAYYALSLKEYHMPMHVHESCEIMYVTGGGCRVFCQDQAYALSANQFIFIRPLIPHRLEISSSHPCAILNLEFDFSAAPAKPVISVGRLLEICPEFPGFFRQPEGCAAGDDLRSLGYAMKDLISQLPKSARDAPALLGLLFYRTMLELVFCTSAKRPSMGVLYLKKACAYIEGHLLDPLTVPEVAARTGIHKSYLQLLFSREMHCSVNAYINQKRLEQAAFLLTNSSLGVIDIAVACGYNSRQHFAHTFEKFYGLSPSRYRSLHSRSLVPSTGVSQYLLDENGAPRKRSDLVPRS